MCKLVFMNLNNIFKKRLAYDYASTYMIYNWLNNLATGRSETSSYIDRSQTKGNTPTTYLGLATPLIGERRKREVGHEVTTFLRY